MSLHVSDSIKHVRVLIVEDDALSAYIARQFLNELSCKVDCASDGEEALAYFNQYSYDLILMDISLPGVDGYTLVTQIKENKRFKKKPLPIIALTVHEGEANKNKCLEAGMNAVFIKPLLKITAREILQSFVPQWKEMLIQLNDYTHTRSFQDNDIQRKVINFDHVFALYEGDVNFIKNALNLVIEDFNSALNALKLACQQKKWGEGGMIIHKLQSGIRYFGLERLEQVCIQFNQILLNPPEMHWESEYHLMLDELRKIQEVYTRWLEENK